MFSFDTSGYVLTTSQFPPPGDGALTVRWSDLKPFPQGHIEALFSEMNAARLATVARPYAFRDLAPETLALILRDCAAFVAARDAALLAGMTPAQQRAQGLVFWRLRQAGDMIEFPRLNPTLADDGFVYLRGASLTARDCRALPQ